MEGVGGTIKYRMFPDVKSGKVSIKNAKHFTINADSILNGHYIYLQSNRKVLEQPENIDSSSRNSSTLEVHKIALTFSTDGISKMEFYYTAMIVVTQNFHYRTTLILHVLSAMELMQQTKNGWNATYAINGSMKSVFSFKNFFFNIFSSVLKVL